MSWSRPLDLQITSLREAYASGRVTPLDVAKAVLARIAVYSDPAVWIGRAAESEVLARATTLMATPGAAALPLYGVPFAVKDNIDAAGFETTAACPAYAYEPLVSATVVERLLAAGAMLIGKTNLDQFATGLVGTRSPYGAPSSVFNPDYISGGSSSGSAVSVGAGLVSFSLGTDTAGSGRVPAAHNHIVGLKPTRGLIPATGVVPACRSLDCVSVFAGTVGDALTVLGVAAGFDEADPYSRVGAPVALGGARSRFGVPTGAELEFFGDAAAAALFERAVDRLTALGHEPVPIDYAPFREVAALLYGGPWVAERYAAIRDFIENSADAMDPTVRRVIGAAPSFSAADAFDGQYRLKALAGRAAKEMAKVDMLLLPTTPILPTKDEVARDPIGVNSRQGLYTNFVNLLDMAAVAVPAGFRASNGTPFGVTLVGPAFSDRALGWVADRLHRALPDDPGVGITGFAPSAAAAVAASAGEGAEIRVVVAGAHLSGMALNGQLTALGGTLDRATKTAPDYRLHALAGTVPPKPGLVRAPGFEGPGIAVEVWRLSPAAFGQFVAAIPAPMGIGRVLLEDGEELPGFICEPYALAGARDITEYGGWRAFRAAEPG